MRKKGEIHYLTHQISTNKTSPSKMNQLRKVETLPKKKPTQQNTTQLNNLILTQEQKLFF